MNKYLQDCKISKVPEGINKRINEDISTEEIMEVISALEIGKAPGPDGLTSIFFKIYKKQLTYLGQIMNEALQGKDIPDSWEEAAITLIHKEGLDALDVRNKRPIFLLKTDYKIYASILANRLKDYLVDYIDEDQVGFYHIDI